MNAWNVPQPPPEGTTEEFGFNLYLFNDKLTIRANRFETMQLHLGGAAQFSFRACAIGVVDLASLGGNDFVEDGHWGE